eukprot:998820_1
MTSNVIVMLPVACALVLVCCPGLRAQSSISTIYSSTSQTTTSEITTGTTDNETTSPATTSPSDDQPENRTRDNVMATVQLMLHQSNIDELSFNGIKNILQRSISNAVEIDPERVNLVEMNFVKEMDEWSGCHTKDTTTSSSQNAELLDETDTVDPNAIEANPVVVVTFEIWPISGESQASTWLRLSSDETVELLATQAKNPDSNLRKSELTRFIDAEFGIVRMDKDHPLASPPVDEYELSRVAAPYFTQFNLLI